MPDIKHKLCQHKDRTHKMQRLYKRENGRFVPVAWMYVPGPRTGAERQIMGT